MTRHRYAEDQADHNPNDVERKSANPRLDHEEDGEEAGRDEGTQGIDDDQIDVHYLDGVGQPDQVSDPHGEQKVKANLCQLLVLFKRGLVTGDEGG